MLAVLALAVGLWMTDSLTGIHPGWTALLAACACALPFMGVLDGNSFKQVPLGSLLFVSAAVAIGAVGGATGMNAWLAQSLLPGGGQQTSTVLFTVAAAGFCILVHMVLGSTMAVVSITGPAVLTFGASAGASPLVCVMLAYCAVALHWLLPFHHMNLLVGSAQEGDLMQGKQVVQFGAFQTLVVLAVCAAGMLWWETLGI